MDNKLAGTLELGKPVVITGQNSYFPLSIDLLVTISTGAIVETIVTAAIGYGFLDVEIDDKLSCTQSLEKLELLLKL